MNSCSNDSTPLLDFIEVDHSKDIVGTWTCLEENYASALVLNSDGTAMSMGVGSGEYWNDVDGSFSVKNNNLLISFENGHKVDVRIDLIPNEGLSIVTEDGKRHTYQYCENDLSDEIVGMWVCNEGLTGGVSVMSYADNGKFTITSASALSSDEPLVKQESDYIVVGDLVFVKLFTDNEEGKTIFTPARMIYSPNGTSVGDIMTHKKYIPSDNGLKETVMSFLRIKQSLDLAKKEYDYSNVYVTNVKADDVEFDFAGQKLNFAALDGSMMDKMMRNILFNVSFPTADKFVYTCYVNDNKTSIEAPIVVDGNKITIKMSENKAVYRDIDVYTFQDVDACQMHMYMPRSSFVKFIANIGVVSMSKNGELDLNDTEAVKAVYDDIDKAIETINVSFIFKSDK